MASITNTEDEIFWRDVRNAVDQVSTNQTRQVTVTRGTQEATVAKASDAIMIAIVEVVPEQPVLVAPSG
jgi:hypothetical protein